MKYTPEQVIQIYDDIQGIFPRSPDSRYTAEWEYINGIKILLGSGKETEERVAENVLGSHMPGSSPPEIVEAMYDTARFAWGTLSSEDRFKFSGLSRTLMTEFEKLIGFNQKDNP